VADGRTGDPSFIDCDHKATKPERPRPHCLCLKKKIVDIDDG
jgi:hypothetical protein